MCHELQSRKWNRMSEFSWTSLEDSHSHSHLSNLYKEVIIFLSKCCSWVLIRHFCTTRKWRWSKNLIRFRAFFVSGLTLVLNVKGFAVYFYPFSQVEAIENSGPSLSFITILFGGFPCVEGKWHLCSCSVLCPVQEVFIHNIYLISTKDLEGPCKATLICSLRKSFCLLPFSVSYRWKIG